MIAHNLSCQVEETVQKRRRNDTTSHGRRRHGLEKINVAVIREHSVTDGKRRKTANFHTFRSLGDAAFDSFFGVFDSGDATFDVQSLRRRKNAEFRRRRGHAENTR